MLYERKLKNLPSIDSRIPDTDFDLRVFMQSQQIQQRPGESFETLHERLRPYIRNRFAVIEKPTMIKTFSWYTFDASSILGENAVVVSTSTCKHETPLWLFVGIRNPNFQKELPNHNFEYIIYPLNRKISDEEKDHIYDAM